MFTSSVDFVVLNFFPHTSRPRSRELERLGLGLVSDLQRLGLVSDKMPNVSVSSRSRTFASQVSSRSRPERSRAHPCEIQPPIVCHATLICVILHTEVSRLFYISCYIKCIVFGYNQCDSVTQMLLDIGLPSFNRVIHNYQFTFTKSCLAFPNSIVGICENKSGKSKKSLVHPRLVHVANY